MLRILASLLVLVVVCLAQNDVPTTDISYNHVGTFSESLGYSEEHNYFITGNGFANWNNSLLKIDPEGNVTPFSDDERLQYPTLLTLGIKVDNDEDEVIFVVANTTVAFGGYYDSGVSSALVFADAETGDVNKFVDLSSFEEITANDFDSDGNGNYYITDSAGGRIIKYDSNGDTSEYVSANTLLQPTIYIPFGVDGIVYLDDDLIIVTNLATDTILRITDGGDTVTVVTLNCTLESPDGMITDGKDILVVENTYPYSYVTRLRSKDGWETAECVGEGTSSYSSGSAIVFVKDNLFMSHSPQSQSGYYDSSVLDVVVVPGGGSSAASIVISFALLFVCVLFM